MQASEVDQLYQPQDVDDNQIESLDVKEQTSNSGNQSAIMEGKSSQLLEPRLNDKEN